MRIIVCVRAVPDLQARFRLNADQTGYDADGLVFHVNEYDLFAMEEAVRIKERFRDVEITAVSVGPPSIEPHLIKAMALGADRGFIIDDSARPAVDALSIASLIAAWTRDQCADLILCGVMSEDMQRCQVGPMLARLLGFPCATTVVSLEIAEDRKSLTCERELEAGARERLELGLPALITVQSGINLPRYASLSNLLRVKSLSIPRIEAASLGPVSPGEIIARAYLASSQARCEFIEGHPAEAAQKLLEKIRARVGVP